MQAVDAGKCKYACAGSALIGLITALLLALPCLVAAAYIVLYLTPGYFEKEYAKYDVLSSLPEMTMSGDDGLMAVTDHMMEYLLTGDEPEELQIEVMMGGEIRGFFTDREIAHMKDVRALFRIFMYGGGISLTAAVLLAGSAAFLACHREPLGPGAGCRAVFGTGFGAGLIAGVAVIGLAAAALLILGGDSFSELFINFHLALFDNDLWLLDPREDMLINIVPEGFFYDTAIRIGVIFALFMALLAAAGGFIMRRGKR